MAAFTQWFYAGLGSVGGWAVFTLLGVLAVLWLLIDSIRRHLPAGVWRLGTFLPAVVMLAPAIVVKLSAGELPVSAAALAVVGVLGGVIPAGVAVAYTLRFRGLVGCVRGHKPYRAELTECPVCARQTVQGMPGVRIEKPVTDPKTGGRKTSRGAVKSSKPRADGWLVDEEGSVYQVNQGNTTIGRAPQNDIRLWDGSASRTHAKIVEEKGAFTIFDLGSVAGTWINGQRVRRPETLKSGDVVTFGTSTRMTFTTQPGELP